ncbi:Na+/H+ antiporter NhaC [Peribacillus simplex]|uniref:Na+/H+ antiporter NhaC n=1 Tax=Peribacillus simplex TaxID=1478 RepID=UPI003D08EE12
MNEVEKKVSLKVALLTILVLITVLSIGNGILKLPTDIVFIVATIAISIVLLTQGFKGKELQEYFVDGCKKSLLVVLILMSVGMVIGSWIVSGIVPSIIFYGLKLLSPTVFLVSGFLILCVTSFFIGSAYASAGTLGVAFMGIGYGMGIPPALTAGMVVSGAIFGNKISPFADTTNLAVAVTGVELTSHIRSMLYSVLPILVISTILYGIQGMKFSHNTLDVTKIDLITDTLSKHFVISPFLLLVPVLTILLAAKKVPPLIALLISALGGVVAAALIQTNYDINTIFTALSKGFQIQTGVEQVDNLLNRGGIANMMPTVTLSILILGFGEILQRTGIVSAILGSIKNTIKSARSLVLTTLFSGLVTDMLTASQYMSIILPGQMFKSAYKKHNVSLTVLSRTLEDGGTMFSYLVPWSLTAIYLSGVLGVSTLDFFPYAYQAVLTPILAIIYAITGFAIFKEKGNVNEDKEHLEEKSFMQKRISND